MHVELSIDDCIYGRLHPHLMGEHNVQNLKGTFMYKDIPFADFCIEEACLTYFKETDRDSNWRMYPAEWVVSIRTDIGITGSIEYITLNEYFKNHVVEDGAYNLHNYLKSLGLDHYDLDEIIKRNNGTDWVTDFWVKFEGVGCQSYAELREFVPPLVF